MAVRFWEAAALCFVAEIGDVTFFQTAVFAMWCPLRGIRRGPCALERSLVLTGSLLALTMRVALRQLEISFSRATGEGLAPLGVSVLMLGLAVRAYLQLKCSDRAVTSGGQMPEDQEKPASAAQAPTAPGGSFLGNFKAYNPSEYAAGRGYPVQGVGTTSEESRPISAGASAGYGAIPQVKDEAPESSALSKLTALWLPFLVAYFAEAGSQGMELQVLHDGHSMSSMCGGFLGYALATMVAGITSFVLERQVSPATLLFGVMCSTAAISLACLRSACLFLLAAAYSLAPSGKA